MRDAGTEAVNSLCKVNVTDGMLNVSGYVSGPGDSLKVGYLLHLWDSIFISLFCQIVTLSLTFLNNCGTFLAGLAVYMYPYFCIFLCVTIHQLSSEV